MPLRSRLGGLLPKFPSTFDTANNNNNNNNSYIDLQAMILGIIPRVPECL
jgi:hypothetical protein